MQRCMECEREKVLNSLQRIVWGFRPPGKPQIRVRSAVREQGSVFMSSGEDEKQGLRNQGKLLRCQSMDWMNSES